MKEMIPSFLFGLLLCFSSCNTTRKADNSIEHDAQLFEPELFAAAGLTANLISFSPEGDGMIASAYKEDYDLQGLYSTVKEKGRWKALEPISFAQNIYNGTFSRDGRVLIYSRSKENEQGMLKYTVFCSQMNPDGYWSEPVNLTQRDGIEGGYFWMLPNKNLYYYYYDSRQKKGGIYRSEWNGGAYSPREKLPDIINRHEPFGNYVSDEEDLILFTQYVEKEKDKTGIFFSIKVNGIWTKPKKIDKLPYGWGVFLSPDKKWLYFHHGDEFKYYRVPLKQLRWAGLQK